MSLPNPITRKEEYLNAIATGGTDYPITPITREEAYLDAIAKSGGGVSGVASVNGKTGVVTLNASDVNALPSSTVIPIVSAEAVASTGDKIATVTVNGTGVDIYSGVAGLSQAELNTLGGLI